MKIIKIIKKNSILNESKPLNGLGYPFYPLLPSINPKIIERKFDIGSLNCPFFA